MCVSIRARKLTADSWAARTKSVLNRSVFSPRGQHSVDTVTKQIFMQQQRDHLLGTEN